MQGIFISYRRQDSQSAAGRLADHLRGHMPGVPIFRGVETVEPGIDFVEAIGRALQSCGILLAVIGPRWVSLPDGAGRRRLDDPNDPTRLEIASALQRRNVRVIPVLVGGARMPGSDDLPSELKALARRSAIELTEACWEYDVLQLEKLVSQLIGTNTATALPSPPGAAPPPALGTPSVLQRSWEFLRRVTRREASAAESEDVIGYSERAAKQEPEATFSAPPVPRAKSEPPRVTEAVQAPSAPSEASKAASERVYLGASAPRAVKPGDEFTARFVAYVADHEAPMRIILSSLSPNAESHLGLKTCQWQVGSQLAVQLAARVLQVSPREQTFVWNGLHVLLDFDVTVPETTPQGIVVLKFDVLMAGITVAMLRLDLEIAASASAERAEASGRAARSAFASYSAKDRNRVLDRIDAVRIAAGLDIFLDCLSLHPGEPWKERLDWEIPRRDLFMLFWSAEAAKSEWVEWEWRRALALKGLRPIQIHPLENGVKPPQELGTLHFGSVAMYAYGTDEG